MHIGRTLYWLLTGALIGFGFIAILSIGAPFVLLGVILAVIGAIRFRGRGIWAALVGFGALPAAILVWDVVSAPWACEGGTTSLINVNYYTCVDTFVGPLTTYHVMALGFGVVALLGIAWPLLHHLWRARRSPRLGAQG